MFLLLARKARLYARLFEQKATELFPVTLLNPPAVILNGTSSVMRLWL